MKILFAFDFVLFDFVHFDTVVPVYFYRGGGGEKSLFMMDLLTFIYLILCFSRMTKMTKQSLGVLQIAPTPTIIANYNRRVMRKTLKFLLEWREDRIDSLLMTPKWSKISHNFGITIMVLGLVDCNRPNKCVIVYIE